MKTRTIETTLAALEDGNNITVPPLMNPSMLEATDDLTNLSHLNEPAGECGSVLQAYTVCAMLENAVRSC